MSDNRRVRLVQTQWLVRPKGLPYLRRGCLNCPSTRFHTQGKFRVNAHRKVLDVWLLALCASCGETAKLAVMERVNVRAVDPATLAKFHGNDLDLAVELLSDPAMLRRNAVSLDWEGAWEVQTDPVDLSEAEVVETVVCFARPIPIRPVRLLSAGLGVSRSEVERLVADGRISSASRLSGKSSGDFGFTLRL